MKNVLLRALKVGAVLLFWNGPLRADEPQIILSGVERTALLELYTSEGCSSCPSAEAWLGRLEKQANLWSGFVPVAFHVDYWDGLGWPDLWAKAIFTQRQKTYAAQWKGVSLYTPDIVWNGTDWPEWSRAGNLPSGDGTKPGILEAEYKKTGEVKVKFAAGEKWKGGTAYIALLAWGLQTEVKRGENAGRRLQHDFVAIEYKTGELVRNTRGEWQADFNGLIGTAPRLALAFWVEPKGTQEPIQAGGGWLEPNGSTL